MDPNPIRSGMDIVQRVSQTRIVKHKIAMIKYRQQIAAYTFTKYTRHIRQLLSHPFNDNKSSYQENMLLCQRALVAGFLTWLITSHICEIFGCTEIALDFHWLVKLLQRRSLSLLFPPSPPPSDFGVEAIGFMYCPTTCKHSPDLVRSKRQTGSIHFWIVRKRKLSPTK